MIPPTLQTDRLVLKPLSIEDAGALFHYRSDERVFQYQSWQPTESTEAEQFIQEFSQGEFGAAQTWYQMGLYLKQSQELIGDIGLHFLEEQSQCVEIGFTVAPEFQRRGYAHEAVRGILTFLFDTLGKHRVTASTDPRNIASIALLEKLGLRKEAHLRESLHCRGEWVDDVVFAILQDEWIS